MCYILADNSSLLIGPTFCNVDDIIAELQQHGLKLTMEGMISNFLGIKIRHSLDREFQPPDTATSHQTDPQGSPPAFAHGTNVTPKKTPASTTDASHYTAKTMTRTSTATSTTNPSLAS